MFEGREGKVAVATGFNLGKGGGKGLHTLFSYHARSLVCATVRIPRRLLHPHKEAVTGVLWRPKNPISHWVASRT